MLKELIDYLINLSRPEIVEQGGKTYSTHNLNQLDREQPVDAINIRSLSGLVDYIKSNFDHEREVMIHVESPTKVRVFDPLNDVNDRRTYVKAEAMLPSITFERHMNREEFNIMLQACFVNNDHKEKVLKFIGSLVEDNSVIQDDDGISQKVTAKTGIASLGLSEVPNPVGLKPFRTFVEVAQPESEFVLRLREGGKAGLFEADGGAWELNAMQNIKEYFKEELKDLIESGKVIIVA